MDVKIFLRSTLVLLMALGATPALATERSDIVAGLGTLPLLIDKISGDVKMAVILDPDNPASKADADNILKIVEAGIDVPGGGHLSAMPVSIHDLGKLSRVRLAVLTPGLHDHFSDIRLSASAASILTFSTDIDCVKAGACIIGVATTPAVTVYFSKSAADAAKIEFTQAFAMLVREL